MDQRERLTGVRMLSCDNPHAPADLACVNAHHFMCCCSGEILLKDGQLLPTALKRVRYNTPYDKAAALNEVEALYDALGMPHTVQCLAVFEQIDPYRTESWLWIAME